MDLRTSGRSGFGISGLYRLDQFTSGQVGSQGEVRIDARGGTIVADGKNAGGITGSNASNGNVVIDARDLTIRSRSHGIWGQQEKGSAIDAEARVGDVTIYTENLSLETADPDAKGIVGWNKKTGDVKIDVVDTIIDTKSTAFVSGQNYTDSHGIWGVHQGIGDIYIDARGGSLTTAGDSSRGIYGLHTGDGNIIIETGGEHRISTTGPNGHGILGYHLGTGASRSMDITVGGTLAVDGADAHGVQLGTVSNGEPARVAATGADGYLQQTVRINGSMSPADPAPAPASSSREAARSTSGRRAPSAPSPASRFEPPAAATPHSTWTWILTAAGWRRSSATTGSSTTAARPPLWSTT